MTPVFLAETCSSARHNSSLLTLNRYSAMYSGFKQATPDRTNSSTDSCNGQQYVYQDCDAGIRITLAYSGTSEQGILWG